MILRKIYLKDLDELYSKYYDTTNRGDFATEEQVPSREAFYKAFKITKFYDDMVHSYLIESDKHKMMGIINDSYLNSSTRSIGILMFNVEDRNHGYGTEAMIRLSDRLLGPIDGHTKQLQAVVDLDNIAALKMTERAGFTKYLAVDGHQIFLKNRE